MWACMRGAFILGEHGGSAGPSPGRRLGWLMGGGEAVRGRRANVGSRDTAPVVVFKLNLKVLVLAGGATVAGGRCDELDEGPGVGTCWN